MLVGLSGVLVIVQMLLASVPRMLTFGFGWASGPRDATPGVVSERAGRADRAYRNLMETFPVFAAGAVAVVVADAAGAGTALGAWLYLLARVAYVPAYIFHVPLLRTLLWAVSIVGIVLVLWPLLTGAGAGG